MRTTLTLVGVRVNGPPAIVVARLAKSLNVPTAVPPIERNLIHPIHPIRPLPDFASRIQQLPPNTLALRRAFKTVY